MKRSCALLVILVLCAGAVPASTWYVRPGGAGTQTGTTWDKAFPTVADGLLAALPGDTVKVAEGTYHERIRVPHGVALLGGFVRDATGAWSRELLSSTLDGDNLGATVTFLPGATVAEVSGFIIQHGTGNADGKLRLGGAVYARDAQVLLADNLMISNSANIGGAVYLAGGAAELVRNRFEHNAAGTGGGLYAAGGQLALYANAFSWNTADARGAGLALSGMSEAACLSNYFRENRSFGVAHAVSITGSASLVNSTIVRNVGGGGAVELNAPEGVVLANNLIVDNDGGIVAANVTDAPQVRYNDVFRNASFNYQGLADPTGTNGNISVEPMTVSADNLTPRTYSPLVDAGRTGDHDGYSSDYAGRPRILGTAPDIGAYEADCPAPKLAVRVKPDGNDANDGSTWALAMHTVQAAVNRAVTQDREVWVAAGRYDGGVNITHNVALYGGFSGTEGRRSQRDPGTHETILTAGTTSTAMVIKTTTDPVDRTTVVDGFTLGGVSVEYTNTLPEIQGGALRIVDSSPTITNNRMTGSHIRNRNGGLGGGIYIDGGAPLIARNTIWNNEAEDGGGIYATGADAEIAFNFIAYNNARRLATDSEYTTAMGGGVYLAGGAAVVERNVFDANWSQDQGGGFYGGGAAVTVCGNTFTENVAGYGGGLHTGSDTLIHSNVFTGNRATEGGAIRVRYGAPRIISNTVVNNTASTAGAVYLRASDAKLANNIIALNASGIYRYPDATGAPVLTANDVFGNTGAGYENLAPSATDISADPLFLDPAGDYRLRADSPCYNRGDDASIELSWLDADGEHRKQSLHTDMGAFESAVWTLPTWRDVVTALRMAGGLEAARPESMLFYNTVPSAVNAIDVRDVARLARQAAGTDPPF